MEQVRFRTENLRVDHEMTSASERPRHGTSFATMRTLDPMRREEASKLVRRLLAGYPNLSAIDPKSYLAAMIEVMGEYPAWAGQQAVLKVDEENSQFPPSDKTLRKWLEDAVRPYRFAQEWDERSRKQIAERPPEDPPKQYLGTTGDGGVGTVYSSYDKAVGKHGRPFGRFEKDRQLP